MEETDLHRAYALVSSANTDSVIAQIQKIIPDDAVCTMETMFTGVHLFVFPEGFNPLKSLRRVNCRFVEYSFAKQLCEPFSAEVPSRLSGEFGRIRLIQREYQYAALVELYELSR